MAGFFSKLAYFGVILYRLVTILSSSTSVTFFVIVFTNSSDIQLDLNLKQEKRKRKLESNQEPADTPPKKRLKTEN